MDAYCTCGSILPLSPGETCEICGHTIPMKEGPVEFKYVEEFYYQSQVDRDKNGVGVWKRAGNEEHCLNMARLHFEVKKIIRKVPVGARTSNYVISRKEGS